ncbi:hypothetical protein SLS62_008651 [Diatrype stigma]|uniref:Uncharacterized protein n=1 Tax=Diatrype stigma TaxID=117547 RepID=A0AAN9UTR4_9PEZI
MPSFFNDIIDMVSEKGRGGSKEEKTMPFPADRFGGKMRLAMELGNFAMEAGEFYKTRSGGKNSLPALEAFCGNLQRYLKNPEKWVQLFQSFVAGSVAMGVMQVLQGSGELEKIGIRIHGEMQAHTGLDAPKKFSEIALHYLESETSTVHGDALDHLYFLYHPDTDWHGYFHRTFPDNFLGMSEHLELLCAFMLFTRRNLRRSKRHARFHLLIPSYRPMAVRQPYHFAEELYPLTIHGVRHDAQTRVWLNLPGAAGLPSDRLELKDVENIAALPEPPNLWQQTRSFLEGFLSPPKPPAPIVLGVSAAPDAAAGDGDEEEELLRYDDGFSAAVGTTDGVHGSVVGGDNNDDDGGFIKQSKTGHVSRRRKRRHRSRSDVL